jgi:hypothetical protein
MSRSFDNYEEIPQKNCHPRSLGLNLRFIRSNWGFDDRAFDLLLLKNITLAFERLVIEIPESLWKVAMKLPV